MSRCLSLLLSICLLTTPALAQKPESAQGPPPALVEVAAVTRGEVAPQSPYVGTVVFPEVSDVAAEVNGKVASVNLDEGRRVTAGAPLVRLDAEVLQMTIESLEASRAEAQQEQTKARLDAERFAKLLKEKTVSLQEYETYSYRQQGLTARVRSLAASAEALKVQLSRKVVRAPFDGLVIERRVERGEWVEPGTVVATIARSDEIDLLASVPEEIVAHLKAGQEVGYRTLAGSGTGKVHALIPRGDLKTRTFPLKVRAENRHALLEGMEATLLLPTGQAEGAFIVPRDALIPQGRQTVIFLVEEGAARQLPVQVGGYHGLMASVEGEGLSEGAQVVVKGNERLQPGQKVQILPGDG